MQYYSGHTPAYDGPVQGYYMRRRPDPDFGLLGEGRRAAAVTPDGLDLKLLMGGGGLADVVHGRRSQNVVASRGCDCSCPDNNCCAM